MNQKFTPPITIFATSLALTACGAERDHIEETSVSVGLSDVPHEDDLDAVVLHGQGTSTLLTHVYGEDIAITAERGVYWIRHATSARAMAFELVDGRWTVLVDDRRFASLAEYLEEEKVDLTTDLFAYSSLLLVRTFVVLDAVDSGALAQVTPDGDIYVAATRALGGRGGGGGGGLGGLTAEAAGVIASGCWQEETNWYTSTIQVTTYNAETGQYTTEDCLFNECKTDSCWACGWSTCHYECVAGTSFTVCPSQYSANASSAAGR